MSTEEERISSLDALHGKLDKLLSGSAGGSKPDEKPAPAGSIDEQVSAAVAKASERERQRSAREKKEQEIEERFSKLEKLMERSPVSLRPITKLFWGDS